MISPSSSPKETPPPRLHQDPGHPEPGNARSPRVSILIPVHNGLEFTRACLASILAHAGDDPLTEILVVDDGSTDGTAAYLDSLAPRVRVIPLPGRLSFAEKMNLAAPLAQGEFLCLLNNDTKVTAGWLQPMLEVLEAKSDVAIVGNRHLTPGSDLIDHAGMVFDAQGFPMHLYRGQPSDFGPALVSGEFQILTAACWLLRKQVFLDHGGFDSDFQNGWEDIDFCLRLRQSGWKVFYAAESVIYHHGSSTPGRKDHEAINVELFKARWGRSIVSDLNEHYVPPPPPPEHTGNLEKRLEAIHQLQAHHPVIASALRSVVRLCGSIAKRLNRGETDQR